MARYENELYYWINDLQPRDWMLALACAIVIGLVCLKGMGSRAKN